MRRTSAHSCSTGMSERTDRMRLLMKSSGASASSRPPTTCARPCGPPLSALLRRTTEKDPDYYRNKFELHCVGS